LEVDSVILIVMLVCAFAGWRLTRALVEEDVGEPVRKWIGAWVWKIKVEDEPDPKAPPKWKTWIGDLVVCPYCVGWWMTAVITLVVGPQLLDLPILAWLALAAGAAGVQALLVDIQHKIDVSE
jgi:Protein of unknown function (DUF1360)